MPLKVLPIRKCTAKNLNQIGPYDTVTDPHRPIFFPMWPASQKELHTTELNHTVLEGWLICGSNISRIQKLNPSFLRP
jgi:hypothetical protein